MTKVKKPWGLNFSTNKNHSMCKVKEFLLGVQEWHLAWLWWCGTSGTMLRLMSVVWQTRSYADTGGGAMMGQVAAQQRRSCTGLGSSSTLTQKRQALVCVGGWIWDSFPAHNGEGSLAAHQWWWRAVMLKKREANHVGDQGKCTQKPGFCYFKIKFI